MSWDPEQYLLYADARRRPALDLLARLGDLRPANLVDLGCGTGNITRLLAERWPAASITALDNDAAMLERARAAGAERIDWQQADIAGWQTGRALDLIFSNAALHWLPDHERLLPHLLGQLADGGVLAVQMPANFAAPAHQILRELTDDPGWQEEFQGLRMGAILAPDQYLDLLVPLCRQFDLWETTYRHVLPGDDGLLDWLKGTTLRPYLARLDGQSAEYFLATYRARLREAYPQRSPGRTLFPFKRIFFVAQR